LLTILNITKQSLSRVLSALVDTGYVIQKKGPEDRRQRLLFLTDTGTALEARLTAVQGRRFANTYREAGMSAVEGFHRVLEGLLDPQTRRQIDKLGKASGGSGES
jgi:DNA-binding MarR family transcriptional regulator